MKHGYVKFTGDYTKLKSMGYFFQKLYARNYMTWNKGDIWIYKKGSDIVHDALDLYKLLKFLQDKPIGHKLGGIAEGTTYYYKFYHTDRRSFDYDEVTPETRDIYYNTLKEWGNVTKDTPEDQMPSFIDMEYISDGLIEQLNELKKLGWYELAVR